MIKKTLKSENGLITSFSKIGNMNKRADIVMYL